MAKAWKTHKSMAKRIKVTKKGKFMKDKSWKNHLLTNKWRTTKNNPYGEEVSKSERRRIKALIPFKLRG